MKKCLKIVLFLLLPVLATAQQSRVDSVIMMLEKSKTEHSVDTVKFVKATEVLYSIPQLSNEDIAQLKKAVARLNNGIDEYWSYILKERIFFILQRTDLDKAIAYGRYQFEQLEKSKAPNAQNIRSFFLIFLRDPYRNSGRLAEGFQFYTSKLKEYKLKNDSSGIWRCYSVLSGFYQATGLMDQAIYNLKKSTVYIDTLNQNKNDSLNWFAMPNGLDRWIGNINNLARYFLLKGDYSQCIEYSLMAIAKHKAKDEIPHAFVYIAEAKLLSGQLDSVEYYLNQVIEWSARNQYFHLLVEPLQIQALYKIKTKKLNEADSILLYCWQLLEKYKMPVNSGVGILAPDYYLALVRIEQNRITDAIALLTKDIERVKYIRQAKLKDFKLLAELYEKVGDHKSSKDAYKSFLSLQDSLLADQAKYGNISFETEKEMSEKELAITKLQSENKISSLTRNFTIGIAALLLILAVGLFQRFRFKQKANLALEKTLSELKSTQSQLIQSEKMASLGELTAGIAHEIQNPLNFVNNFSEVSNELIDEMNTELEKGDIEEAKTIAKDVKQNLEKINHHGKRADAIVKGMLQHSRSSSGVKEPTDLNALCDEYLRLAYHGLRAKDKSFNSKFETDFDPNLPKLNVIPQDIGRVVLNLITNAFYAVNERLRHFDTSTGSVLSAQPDSAYEPTVSVSTKKEGDKVLISVKDNGNGIPQKVLDKIFQPFFTTKPTGQGTGLGLSLSYDIVKAHGGELKVETKEGDGSEFIIQLPFNSIG